MHAAVAVHLGTTIASAWYPIPPPVHVLSCAHVGARSRVVTAMFSDHEGVDDNDIDNAFGAWYEQSNPPYELRLVFGDREELMRLSTTAMTDELVNEAARLWGIYVDEYDVRLVINGIRLPLGMRLCDSVLLSSPDNRANVLVMPAKRAQTASAHGVSYSEHDPRPLTERPASPAEQLLTAAVQMVSPARRAAPAPAHLAVPPREGDGALEAVVAERDAAIALLAASQRQLEEAAQRMASLNAQLVARTAEATQQLEATRIELERTRALLNGGRRDTPPVTQTHQEESAADIVARMQAMMAAAEAGATRV